MTKSELIYYISRDGGINKAKATAVVETIVDKMFNALASGNRIELRGFGSFRINEYDAYKGRNPKNGEVINIPGKKLPFFKPGRELRESVNKPV
jgi:integration host factor subunit beta